MTSFKVSVIKSYSNNVVVNSSRTQILKNVFLGKNSQNFIAWSTSPKRVPFVVIIVISQ